MWLWLFSTLVLALFGRRRCVVCQERVRRWEWRARVMTGGSMETMLGGFANWVRPGVAHHRCVSPSDAMIQRFTEEIR